jgi:hypothetical protein
VELKGYVADCVSEVPDHEDAGGACGFGDGWDVGKLTGVKFSEEVSRYSCKLRRIY